MFDTNPDIGLSRQVAKRRLYNLGPNSPYKYERPSTWELIGYQFGNPVVGLLLLFLLFFVVRFGILEVMVLWLTIMVTVRIPVWVQNNFLDDLKDYLCGHTCTVIRDGEKNLRLPVRELVIGDVVELKAGDKAPADMVIVRLLCPTLLVDEGSLSRGGGGSGELVSKTVDFGGSWHQGCMIFLGTSVIVGHCICMVTDTERSLIVPQVQSVCFYGPLRKRLCHLGLVWAVATGMICALLWLIDVVTHLELAMSLVVAVNPEILLAATTISLAVAAWKMTQRRAVVQKLSCLETVGHTTIIFLDESILQIDFSRKNIPRAIEDCRAAGIRVMVVTGNNQTTSHALFRDLGLLGSSEDMNMRSLKRKDFMKLNDKQSHLRKYGSLLIYNAQPKHKEEIVRLLKDNGEVVAMVGVNDASLLKLADISIAMGITGSQVAKEDSDMILADENFSTIVAAVSEGRLIYDNMKLLIRYLISSNFGEVVCIALAAALGVPEILMHVQLLWVNFLTDGLLAIALGSNSCSKNMMQKPPGRSDDSLINIRIVFRSLVIGLYIGLATVGTFIIWYTKGSFFGIDLSQDGHSVVSYQQLANWGHCHSWEDFTVSPFTAGAQSFKFGSAPCDYFHSGGIKAKTLSLSVLIVMELFNSLNALSEDESLVSMPLWFNPTLLCAMFISFSLHLFILYVPFLAQVFGVVPLSLNEWLFILLVAFPVILIEEVLKIAGRCSFRSRQLDSVSEKNSKKNHRSNQLKIH